ncbi:chaperone for protein-folding within the ER, fungal-domain-containing protein [Lactarius hengduanensis]|nr:chaperone for protein-folding within the ER, fungal-domain-containing protein [Lactarius hengduanensis]
MFVSSVALLALATIPALAQFDAAHNATPIGGTWASGSKNVITGSSFVNPANVSFIYPPTTGISFSFSEDGFYEIARYRMNGNGSSPQCITGVMNWAHGTFKYNDNGSMTMYPFGDGFQQIQAPCSATSNFLENYNDTELFQLWQIFIDPTDGPKLHMYQFDGSPLPPMFLISTTPNMLPTQPLRNVSAPSSTSTSNVSKRSTNDAPPVGRWATASLTAVGGLLVGALLVLA